MQYLIEFFTALYDLSNAMGIYILFGLAFAGILTNIYDKEELVNAKK